MVFISDWQYDRWWLTFDDSNSTSILVSGWDLVTEDQEPINTTYLFPPADAEGMLQKLLNVHKLKLSLVFIFQQTVHWFLATSY